MEQLEKNRIEVFQGSWMDSLDSVVRRDADGFRERETELSALLQLIRNKMEHVRNFGPVLKVIYGGTPGGVVCYYNNCFPKLLPYTYRVWKEVNST